MAIAEVNLITVSIMIIPGKNTSEIKKLKNMLKGKFKIKDLGNVKRHGYCEK